MLFIGWTLCQTCLFEFIRAEESVKFREPVKGAQAIRVLKALHYTDWATQGTFRKQVYSVHCSFASRDTSIQSQYITMSLVLFVAASCKAELDATDELPGSED
jgi:hypothetical protein